MYRRDSNKVRIKGLRSVQLSSKYKGFWMIVSVEDDISNREINVSELNYTSRPFLDEWVRKHYKYFYELIIFRQAPKQW